MGKPMTPAEYFKEGYIGASPPILYSYKALIYWMNKYAKYRLEFKKSKNKKPSLNVSNYCPYCGSPDTIYVTDKGTFCKRCNPYLKQNP